ncbi:MAG: hypothetical protein H3Z54_13855 [archaeon]|nr:hypothetical protein [archaeon]
MWANRKNEFMRLFSESVKGSDPFNKFLLKLNRRDAPNSSEVQIIKNFLKSHKKKAKRQGVWRRFSNIGKGFIDLCITLPLKFVGEALLRALVKTLKELIFLLNPLYRWWVKGVDMAYKISEAAYRFGNKEAFKWRYDRAFIVYWGMVLEGSKKP